jgi:hypothetical protein
MDYLQAEGIIYKLIMNEYEFSRKMALEHLLINVLCVESWGMDWASMKCNSPMDTAGVRRPAKLLKDKTTSEQ